jgi:hypothetical protein
MCFSYLICPESILINKQLLLWKRETQWILILKNYIRAFYLSRILRINEYMDHKSNIACIDYTVQNLPLCLGVLKHKCVQEKFELFINSNHVLLCTSSNVQYEQGVYDFIDIKSTSNIAEHAALRNPIMRWSITKNTSSSSTLNATCSRLDRYKCVS